MKFDRFIYIYNAVHIVVVSSRQIACMARPYLLILIIIIIVLITPYEIYIYIYNSTAAVDPIRKRRKILMHKVDVGPWRSMHLHAHFNVSTTVPSHGNCGISGAVIGLMATRFFSRSQVRRSVRTSIDHIPDSMSLIRRMRS